MAEEISNAVMDVLPNGKSDLIGDRSITCNEYEVDDAEARENLTTEDEIQDDTQTPHSNYNANTNGPVNANLSLRDGIQDEQVRKVTSNRSKGKLSTVASVTSCDSSPVKKSTSYVLATSPVLLGSIMTKEDSPAKGRERDEKIRMLRERKMEEQRKKEEELKESIARAEEVRKRQEEERKKRMEEQRRREEEHRALVEERRRRLWDEEFERRQAIIKRTAEREARIDFKKPYKSALGLSKSCGHSDGTLSSGTARNHVRSLLSPSSLSRQSPTTAADEGNNDNSNKTPRGRMHKSRETTRRSAPLSGTHCERPRSLAPNYCSATISFRIRAGQGADAGTSSGEWNSCICPRFRSTSPSKSRARSMGNIQRSKMDATNGATTLKSSGPLAPPRDKGFIIMAKSNTKPREKTPARVRHSVTPAPVSTNQQEAFDRLRSRRSKTPVVIRNGEELKKTNEECIKQIISNRGGLMVKSMENSSSLQSKNLKKMKSSWAPTIQKEKEKQEKPKQQAVKAVPRKSTVGPQKPTTLPDRIAENGGSPVSEVQQNATPDPITSNKGEDTETNKDIPSNNATTTTPTPTSEVAIGIAKKLSQVEEHQRKLAENRRLAREKAEQKAEEERIRLEKLRIEEEEKQKREEEEARRQEEEELRLIEEAKRIEQERYLKAVEEEAERRRLEEERAEAERKEKLETELRAQEEAERKEKERIEKMKRMAEEKEERKKKLEMIMKRVKADEPISKIDPVRSPTIEDTSNSLSLTTNVTSQPPSLNSDALKHLPGLQEAIPRIDADTSSFKSPLLQKMLGNKIKGVGKSQIVSIANAEETSKPMDVVALTESSDDVCHLEEASKETVDLNNKVSNLGQEISARKSSPVQIQTSLANGSHVKESEARHSPDPDDIPSENSKLGENEKSKLVEVDGHMTNFESPANVSNEVHDAVNCLIDAIDKGSLGLAEVECDDQSGIQNKSNSAESDHKVDEIVDSVVCEEDVKCLLGDSLEDKIPVHEASSTPSISPAEEGLSTLALSDHLIDPSISPTSLLDAPSMCLNSSILSQSKEPLLPNETSLQSLLPTAEANRHEKSERCKSSCTNSDAEEEDDYSNDDSENSQEFSVRPLKFSDVAKELGGQDEGLLKYDEEISSMKNKEDGKKKSFDKEREAIADPFGTWSTGLDGTWSTGLDGTNVLPSMFVGPHLPAETTGTGDGLPKNFGITSQYISE